MPVATEETYLRDHMEAKDIVGEGYSGTSPIMPHMEQQLVPAETANFGLRMLSYQQEEVKGFNEIGNSPAYNQLSVNREPSANTSHYTKNNATHVSASDHASYYA